MPNRSPMLWVERRNMKIGVVTTTTVSTFATFVSACNATLRHVDITFDILDVREGDRHSQRG